MKSSKIFLIFVIAILALSSATNVSPAENNDDRKISLGKVGVRMKFKILNIF